MKLTVIFTISFLALCSVNLSAQRTNVWKGGSPGHENDWQFFKNWSLGKTPDVFDAVIIPDISTKTNRYPEVSSGQMEVRSLDIQSGAMLTLHCSAIILTENFVSLGTCLGCEMRVMLEGSEEPATVSASN